MSKLKKLIIFLLFLVISLPIASFALTSNFLGGMHDSSINTESLDDLSHSNSDGIRNILIMGSDARKGEETSRTDSMMILTIDKVHNDIKITSLARDSFVNIPGHGKSKLTHAYAYGKENLLIKTIEQNFDIDINDFVLINFESFISIIDTIGGVTVDVKQSEINELNKFIPETYEWSTNDNKGKMQLINSPGEQKLNGYQALSFARIRHNDSAFNRDNRQRMIVMSVLKEVKNTSLLKYPSILKSASPYIKTNMKTIDMVKYGVSILSIGTDNIKQMEFPIVSSTKYTTGGNYGNYGWVLRYDPYSVKFLKDFIFNDIEYKEN
ncbi:LCP family protein [Peptostreptococcus faecalis]|uniref:LCP family protein n=1 Tax=Peptostreptococcus faecalis TaxID=2045015 RepID=UPI000C7BB66F|nr:LCP family protein [Peptostreptococcus faecalis]